MSHERILINHAPVLTLWAAIAAERLGFDDEEAFDLGTTGGLGVLTSNSISGQVSGSWSAPTSGGLDGLRRVTQEQNSVVKRPSRNRLARAPCR